MVIDYFNYILCVKYVYYKKIFQIENISTKFGKHFYKSDKIDLFTIK